MGFDIADVTAHMNTVFTMIADPLNLVIGILVSGLIGSVVIGMFRRR